MNTNGHEIITPESRPYDVDHLQAVPIAQPVGSLARNLDGSATLLVAGGLTPLQEASLRLAAHYLPNDAVDVAKIVNIAQAILWRAAEVEKLRKAE